MKRVIDGKVYNTETATKLCEWENGCSRSDFDYEEWELYITRKGTFFLAGSGGARSRWSRSNGDMSVGGSGITPLSPEEALRYAERANMDAEEMVKHWPLEEA